MLNHFYIYIYIWVHAHWYISCYQPVSCPVKVGKSAPSHGVVEEGSQTTRSLILVFFQNQSVIFFSLNNVIGQCIIIPYRWMSFLGEWILWATSPFKEEIAWYHVLWSHHLRWIFSSQLRCFVVVVGGIVSIHGESGCDCWSGLQAWSGRGDSTVRCFFCSNACCSRLFHADGDTGYDGCSKTSCCTWLLIAGWDWLMFFATVILNTEGFTEHCSFDNHFNTGWIYHSIYYSAYEFWIKMIGILVSWCSCVWEYGVRCL